MATKLMKMEYIDKKAEVRLETYADTIVLEKVDNKTFLAAIRFGGYPESVRGMSDAIFGGGSVTISDRNDVPMTVYSHVKQYRRELSHDGIYAEATLMIQDEEQRTDRDEDADGNSKTKNKPRKCYLFCEQGDSDRLFEELDKKTAVPLIPAFKDYILGELQRRDILKQLQVISYREKFDAWALNMDADEKNIVAVVNDGLQSGAISIPGAISNLFPEINSVTQYLNIFGIMIAERIKNQFEPLFDPAAEALSPEILAANDSIRRGAGYSLYDAQLAVAEAHKRCLERGKSTLCIAECGVGKSKIGITALHAYQQKHQPGKHFNIVLCPLHMTRKWVREIEESLPDTFAVVITSITELNDVYAVYERNNKTCYIIMSKEKARDGYMKRPGAIWNKRRKRFLCPTCHKTVMMDLITEGMKYKIPADQLYFRREHKLNHKCEYCGGPLWTALVPNKQSEWVKVSDYGFIHRKLARFALESVVKKPKIFEAVQAVVDNPDEVYPNAGAYRRFSLSTYIKRMMKGKIDGLIVDELHNYNNNSGQGDAMGELFQASKKVVGMTATLINGYSSGIFHLLYRVAPALMLKDGKQYNKPNVFNSEYGVTESVYEIDAPDYNSNRRAVKRKVRERQLPGVSPLVYSRFLIDSAAFLSLNDMGKDLPEYEEFPVQLQMNEDVAEEYFRIEDRFKKVLKTEKDIAQKVMSAFMGLLTVYPDQPYEQKPIIDPLFGDPLITPNNTSSFEELHEKDDSVLGIVKRKVATGERVLIYTSWIRIDTQEKLFKQLTEQGYRVAVLTVAVAPNKREEWVEKQVRAGIQVLITNPSLVETGLDLNDFTTLYYYNIAYNLFTLRQSSRRSWRINQKAPRIEVYFSYYEGTMQSRAIRLMASKLAVAGIIEGNFTDEGLAAMSDCADMTTALARELTMGIRDEVEDLGAVFKRMALLKPTALGIEQVDIIDADYTVVADDYDDYDDIGASLIELIADIEAHTAQSAAGNEISKPSSGLLSLLHHTPKPARKAKAKAVIICEGQISLFDFGEVISA